MLGYIPRSEVMEMTPREWRNLIDGARHSRLDKLEDSIFEATAIARLNNGQKITQMTRNLEEQRAMIDNSKDEYEYQKEKEKVRKRYVYRTQKADMADWWDELNK